MTVGQSIHVYEPKSVWRSPDSRRRFCLTLGLSQWLAKRLTCWHPLKLSVGQLVTMSSSNQMVKRRLPDSSIAYCQTHKLGRCNHRMKIHMHEILTFFSKIWILILLILLLGDARGAIMLHR